MKGIIAKPQTPVYNEPDGDVVMNLAQGAPIKIENIDDEWVEFTKIVLNMKRRGFVKKKFIEPVILWKGEVRVNTSLNVRSGPGTSFDRIASLKSDEKVLVLDQVEGEEVGGETLWYEIMHKEGTAFIFAKYVEQTEEADELASELETLEDEGWGDDADYEVAEDWSDVQEQAQEEVVEEEPQEEEEEEEEGVWNKITSWF